MLHAEISMEDANKFEAIATILARSIDENITQEHAAHPAMAIMVAMRAANKIIALYLSHEDHQKVIDWAANALAEGVARCLDDQVLSGEPADAGLQ